jgi:hypothetical protein
MKVNLRMIRVNNEVRIRQKDKMKVNLRMIRVNNEVRG